MNNNDPNGPSFDVLLDLYANITDPTATDIATRFSGQTPFYTTFTIHIPPSGTSERTWDILTDTSAYSTFYIVAREFNYGSMTNLGIKGDFNSNLTEGSTANMLGGLKYEVKGNLQGSTTLAASTGPTGAQGPSGSQGADGADGAHGADGTDLSLIHISEPTRPY